MITIKRFLIIDGHSLAHRGFHALNKARLTAPDGTPTTMIVGFMNMFFKVQDDLRPDVNVIVFDARGKTFRHELLEGYKKDRKPLDDDLRIQLPILQELLRCLGCNVIIREGVEADDTAASFARLAQGEGYEVMLLSSDKDLFQLIGSGIKLMRPVKNGVSGAEVYDVRAFVEEYGFEPKLMADYLAIVGDKSDNVQGITGIGQIGARNLLAEYGSLENIFDSLDKLKKGTRSKLEAHGLEQALWTRDKLIKLKEDIFAGDTDFLNQCIKREPDIQKAEELAAHLGLFRVLKRLGSSREIAHPVQVSHEFVPPDSEILTLDYKSELKNNPALFENVENGKAGRVWDIKTAYYMLHPDRTAKDFPEVSRALRQSENPAYAIAELAGRLEGQIEAYEGLADVMNQIDLPLIPVLNKIEAHGVRVNHEKFLSLQAELESAISATESRISSTTGVKINMNSPQQVSWLLFERLGFSPEDKGKGFHSTDAAVLERLAKAQGGEIPALILEHREMTKMLTSFVIPFMKAADSDGIIRTTFEPAMTGTGRLSSRDPNLQNIPAFGHWAEEIKSGLVPVNPENVFVSADYSQIELRVLAHLSGEEKLIEAFANNQDIHAQTASWVFGVAPELVTPELRRAAKMINFGLLYGMSSFGLSDRLNIARSEAKDIMSKYFEALPGVKNFIHYIVQEAKERGFTRTLSGRIRPVNEIPARAQALDRAIINSPIQGTAADIARRAMINFMKANRGELFLQVHDSLICECSQGEADEVSEILCSVMKESGGEIAHLETAAKTGKTLAGV
ncbi:MAG: DNA polymerase I [Synergistaceae bacterium]|nr:DNA polymerase I [Synergistaceae bacterium]